MVMRQLYDEYSSVVLSDDKDVLHIIFNEQVSRRLKLSDPDCALSDEQKGETTHWTKREADLVKAWTTATKKQGPCLKWWLQTYQESQPAIQPSMRAYTQLSCVVAGQTATQPICLSVTSLQCGRPCGRPPNQSISFGCPLEQAQQEHKYAKKKEQAEEEAAKKKKEADELAQTQVEAKKIGDSIKAAWETTAAAAAAKVEQSAVPGGAT